MSNPDRGGSKTSPNGVILTRYERAGSFTMETPMAYRR
jgi:hypothetical protein